MAKKPSPEVKIIYRTDVLSPITSISDLESLTASLQEDFPKTSQKVLTEYARQVSSVLVFVNEVDALVDESYREWGVPILDAEQAGRLGFNIVQVSLGKELPAQDSTFLALSDLFPIERSVESLFGNGGRYPVSIVPYEIYHALSTGLELPVNIYTTLVTVRISCSALQVLLGLMIAIPRLITPYTTQFIADTEGDSSSVSIAFATSASAEEINNLKQQIKGLV